MGLSNKDRPQPPKEPYIRPANALEAQKFQIEKLLSDVSKPAFIPPPPEVASLRPAREMMNNVQGSSAGAGSGEFHVYKEARRREYDRLAMMEAESKAEREAAEYNARNLARQEQEAAKLAKNKAKRDKKKAARNKKKGGKAESDSEDEHATKKRKLGASGAQLAFRKDDEEQQEEQPEQKPEVVEEQIQVPVAEERGIMIKDLD